MTKQQLRLYILARNTAEENEANSMWRLIKFLFVLVVLAAIAFVGYAYLGPIFMPNDFAAPVQEIVVPVTLGGG